MGFDEVFGWNIMKDIYRLNDRSLLQFAGHADNDDSGSSSGNSDPPLSLLFQWQDG